MGWPAVHHSGSVQTGRVSHLKPLRCTRYSIVDLRERCRPLTPPRTCSGWASWSQARARSPQYNQVSDVGGRNQSLGPSLLLCRVCIGRKLASQYEAWVSELPGHTPSPGQLLLKSGRGPVAHGGEESRWLPVVSVGDSLSQLQTPRSATLSWPLLLSTRRGKVSFLPGELM